eukprot:TRINITY_DN1925_c0_g1_i2.p1 TRINITY_DN1925_c0_g1~~TRINITY_DN1925_c0_g1_i2.p1  ORF type:complete len:334 (-),score=56.19 TRINITY_DN1925_c0_g1_i2:694-1695(-)
MATLVMRFHVIDYEKWKRDFEDESCRRIFARFHLRSSEILHNSQDRREVIVIHQFESVKDAQLMAKDVDTRLYLDRTGVDMMNIARPTTFIADSNLGPERIGRGNATATVMLRLNVGNWERWNSFFAARDSFSVCNRFWAANNVVTWETLRSVQDRTDVIILMGVTSLTQASCIAAPSHELETMLATAGMTGTVTSYVADSATGPIDLETRRRRGSITQGLFAQMPAVLQQDLTAEQLDNLWDQYDQDGNGNLDEDELASLLKDIFERMKRTLPQLLIAHAKVSGMTVDDIKPQIRKLLHSLDVAPIDTIAAEMWFAMDMNGVCPRRLTLTQL